MIISRGKFILFLVLFIGLYSTAQEKAAYRLIVFEGSDWCSNCLRLERNVLSQSSFDVYRLSKSMQIERIDFPQRNEQDKATKEYNAKMADQYNFQGTFPTVLLVDTEDGAYQQIPYRKQNVDQFIGLIENAMSQ
ncbi:thioredoxin fold domain-containing protein [Aureitalea marina]|uniref:Thioredoxin-like fold domain-containing protein n=1 Tax=Aureitalea marina TaxID=930804 RepID=A0A2S7KMX5_9FLAO|nr:thioredoxin fold domain-containing protein [Aureitalea marina]PQB03962.1 hypothetical protein BST85_02840 [Aureitalea marina]